MDKREISVNGRTMVSMSTDAEHIIHKTGSDDYTPIRKITVREENANDYEELPLEAVPRYTKEEYNAEVEKLIAERYTTGQEIQFAREQDTAGEKYAEYLAYVEECKTRAKENLERKAEQTEELEMTEEEN